MYSNSKVPCSLFLCFSVAFSKICPAGKGYLLQNIRETVAFPPIIFPRKPNKDGESLNHCFAATRSHPQLITLCCLVMHPLRQIHVRKVRFSHRQL